MFIWENKIRLNYQFISYEYFQSWLSSHLPLVSGAGGAVILLILVISMVIYCKRYVLFIFVHCCDDS